MNIEGDCSQPFSWSDDLSTGIAIIDKHHKKLIRLFNELSENSHDKISKENIRKTMKFLTTLSSSCFSAEEELMDKYDFPGKSAHKEKHKKLTDYLQS